MSQKQFKTQPAAQAGSPGETAAEGAEVGGVHSNPDLEWLDLHALNAETRAYLKERRRDPACTHACPRSEGQGDGSEESEIRTPDKIRKLQRTLYRKAKAEPKYRFWSLYGDILRRDLLEHAFQLVSRKGKAPGVDGQTVETICATAQTRSNGWMKWNGNSKPKRTGPRRCAG